MMLGEESKSHVVSCCVFFGGQHEFWDTPSYLLKKSTAGTLKTFISKVGRLLFSQVNTYFFAGNSVRIRRSSWGWRVLPRWNTINKYHQLGPVDFPPWIRIAFACCSTFEVASEPWGTWRKLRLLSFLGVQTKPEMLDRFGRKKTSDLNYHVLLVFWGLVLQLPFDGFPYSNIFVDIHCVDGVCRWQNIEETFPYGCFQK